MTLAWAWASSTSMNPASDDLPDEPTVVLSMYEVPLGARGQDPYAEALEFAVTNVAGGLTRLERVNTAFVEAKRCQVCAVPFNAGLRSRHICAPGLSLRVWLGGVRR